jgi:hypothetical protein
LAGLGAREPADPPIDAPPAFDREYRRLLGLGDRTPEVYVAFVLERDQPKKKQPKAVAFVLEKDQPNKKQPGAVQPEAVATVDRRLLGEFPHLATDLELGHPGFALVRDGKAVSIAFTSRSGGRGAEAGVETLPAYRGLGLCHRGRRGMGGGGEAVGADRLLQRRRQKRRLPGGRGAAGWRVVRLAHALSDKTRERTLTRWEWRLRIL